MNAVGAASDFRDKALRTLSNLPPFSPVLNRLLSTLANEDIPFSRLAAVIEKDTVLAGSVLRLVNSALYGRQGTVNSVTHAIAILGVDKLRNVALTFSVSRMWKNIRTPRQFSIARFNLHSVATGLLADRLALAVPTSYPEGAFAAGLFHDLGKLLIAVTAQNDYDRFAEGLRDPSRAVGEIEDECFGCDHAALSSAALKQWNLPAPIQDAVAHHHAPERSRPAAGSQFPWTLAHLIEAADETTNLLGISVQEQHASAAPVESFPPLKRLGLESRIPELLQDFEAEFANLRAVA